MAEGVDVQALRASVAALRLRDRGGNAFVPLLMSETRRAAGTANGLTASAAGAACSPERSAHNFTSASARLRVAGVRAVVSSFRIYPDAQGRTSLTTRAVSACVNDCS